MTIHSSSDLPGSRGTVVLVVTVLIVGLVLLAAASCTRDPTHSSTAHPRAESTREPAEGPSVVGFESHGADHDYVATYVGGAKCGSCHIGHKELQATHRMALASRRASAANLPLWFSPELLGKPIDWPATEPGPRPVYRREGDRVFLEARGAKGDPLRAEVAAVFGSGHRGFTPISVEAGRGIRELRLTFSGPADHWALTPGAAGDPDPLGYVRSPENSSLCLGCHATVMSWSEDRLDLDRSVLGIDCERCHGPGSAHVEAIVAGTSTPRILNPGRLRGEMQVRFCAQCHRTPADIDPHNVLRLDPSVARQAGAGLLLSACFRRSPPESAPVCLECHNAHRNIDPGRDNFNRPCLRCHATPSEVHRTTGITAASDCVSCHMKIETEGFFGFHFTSHWIRRPEQAHRLEGVERQEYVRLLETYYRDAIARPSRGSESGALLRMRLGKLLVSDGDREEGLDWIRKALALTPLYKDRLQAAELHEKAGREADAVNILEDAILHHPENNFAYHSLARMHVAAGRLEEAQSVLEAWGKARPDDPALVEARDELRRIKGPAR